MNKISIISDDDKSETKKNQVSNLHFLIFLQAPVENKCSLCLLYRQDMVKSLVDKQCHEKYHKFEEIPSVDSQKQKHLTRYKDVSCRYICAELNCFCSTTGTRRYFHGGDCFTMFHNLVHCIFAVLMDARNTEFVTCILRNLVL